MAEITLQQLRKTYSSRRGDVRALVPLDLTMAADGEFITILGPSACGETTLLSLIVGAVPPSGDASWWTGRTLPMPTRASATWRWCFRITRSILRKQLVVILSFRFACTVFRLQIAPPV